MQKYNIEVQVSRTYNIEVNAQDEYEATSQAINQIELSTMDEDNTITTIKSVKEI